VKERLRQALAAEEAWIVGGSIRDELLGRPVTDYDLAVAGDPRRAARAVADAVGGPVFPLSEAFGAWRVVSGDTVIDVSPLQGETIEEDLRKRDFTVNAMAQVLATDALLDPLGGRTDLAAGVLRVIGPEAYASDPLRPLRLARFVAELGFAPDPETERLTREAAPHVAEASGERIFAELRRTVIAPGALAGLDAADRLGLVAAILPELTDLHDVSQSHYHHLDVYDHTREVLACLLRLEGELEERFGELAPRLRAVLDEPLADELTRGQALRFGALLHDIGKPATRGERPDGRVTFMAHDRVGEEMVRSACRRLRTSERLSRFLEAVTRQHLVLGFLVHERPLSRRGVYRYLRRTEPVEVEVTLLSCADRLATRGKNADPAIAAHLELARDLMAEALDWREHGPPRLPLRGDELASELGIDPGPELGRLLAELEEAAFAGEIADREDAVSRARGMIDA
jgi:poly(A) polymerase